MSGGALRTTGKPTHPGPLLLAAGVTQVVAVMGDEVVPGMGQPKVLKMPGLLPLLKILLLVAPVPQINA